MASVSFDEYNPGTVQLEEITLKSLINDKEIDIRTIVLETNVFESLSKPFVTAEFVIEDSLSLISQFPIVGQETIRVKFKTPPKSYLKKIEQEFRVYSIQELQQTKERTVVYVVKAIAPEAINDAKTTVRRSYADMLISEMAKKVFDDYLKVDKDLEVTETETTRTFAIPNLTPANTLRFLAREAKHPAFVPSNYIFFQNNDGFYFKTIEELLSKKPMDKFYTTAKNISQTADDNTASRNAAQKQTKPFEFRKISDIRFIRVFDNLLMMKKGGFANKLFYINPVMSTFNESKFDYNNDLRNMNVTTRGKMGRFLTENADLLNGDGMNHQIYLSTNMGIQGPPEFIDRKPEFIHYVAGSVALLDNVVCNVTIPGDSDRRAGDVIILELPEYSATDDLIDKTHRLLSGTYLVTSVRHIINQEKNYSCVMQCIKNAYEQDPDDIK